MAIVFEAAYSKKLGLPNYSSHSYVVSIRTELTDINQVQEESGKLYKMLQEAVDKEIQAVGFMPDATSYGMKDGQEQRNGNGNNGDDWQCTDKQRDLILRIVEENNLDKSYVEDLAKELFGHGVKSLNRLSASGLIDELFEKFPRKDKGNGRQGKYQRREQSRR
jgi:hypothetical protein